jgi:hypothetical protein
MKKLLLVPAILLLASACGDAAGDVGVETTAPTEASTTTTPSQILSEPVPLVVLAEVGGCYMLGPNCATTLVMSDGRFGAFRNDPADVIAVPATLEGADYTGWADILALSRAIAATDFAELRRTLGAGECRACVDGIDYQVRFLTEDGPEDMSSTDHEFDSALDLFAELDALVQVVQTSGALELLPRGS